MSHSRSRMRWRSWMNFTSAGERPILAIKVVPVEIGLRHALPERLPDAAIQVRPSDRCEVVAAPGRIAERLFDAVRHAEIQRRDLAALVGRLEQQGIEVARAAAGKTPD